MAFSRPALTLIMASGTGRVWGYITPDTIAVAIAANYFASVVHDLEPGDIIHLWSTVVGVTGGAAEAAVNAKNESAGTISVVSSAIFT